MIPHTLIYSLCANVTASPDRRVEIAMPAGVKLDTFSRRLRYALNRYYGAGMVEIRPERREDGVILHVIKPDVIYTTRQQKRPSKPVLGIVAIDTFI